MSGNNFYLECPGAQLTQAEREYIKLMAEQITGKFPNPVFVNLGVMWGASMHCLRAGSKNAYLYGIDTDYKTHEVKNKKDLRPVLFATCDSVEWGHRWKDMPVHIVFVDADHSYEAVQKDIKAWSPHVVSGGLMIFHDYNPTEHNLNLFPEIAGVKKAVAEWWVDAVGEYGYVDSPDSLFVCRKL